MHICYITSEFPGENINHGGIGSFVKFLSESLIKKKINVSIVGIYNIKQYKTESINGVNIHRLPISKIFFGKFYQHSKRLLNKINEIDKKNKIDVIEGSELSFAFFPKKTSYKKVIRLHGGHHFFAKELNIKTSFWRSYQENQSFSKADYYIGVSDYVGKKTQKYLKVKFNYSVIHNTIDEKTFYKSDLNKIKPKTLIFIGTICEKKGIKDLILAMPEIIKRNPNVVLKVLGRDWKFSNGDSYTDYINSIIVDLDIEKNVNIIGPVKHSLISTFIEESQICIYPSHMEAMPIAWLEGLFMNKAVVATDIGPAKELIIDNKTGLLAKPKSPKDLASKINYLLENENISHRIANNAREDMMERFLSNKIIAKNIDFYESKIK